MSIDLDLIKLLINKKDSKGNYIITGYRIGEDTSVSRSTMSKIRKGDYDLNNVPLGKIIELYEYAKVNKDVLKKDR